MNSRLILKEKTENRVIYYYSMDRAGAPSDGEIEYVLATERFSTLKTATGDSDGAHARWLRPLVWRVIFKENCPSSRFIATG